MNVSIYKNSEFTQRRKLRIDASGHITDANNLAFSSKKLKIYAFGLTPYPNTTLQITDKDYELEVLFQPKIINYLKYVALVTATVICTTTFRRFLFW